ncbi:MAG TPA: hypothetical protein VMU45_06840 [Candidatus Eisenbacteria bacterium]|nr:hypothetical protein [Candidatus Eisenbacteria bacterium]
MKRYVGLWLMYTLLTGAAVTAAAQASPDGVMPPPKVLVVFREFVKPGKSGAPHQKTESAFVQAMTAAKWPTHYLGMDSMSGKPRSLFFTGYDSFEAWEKDNKAVEKNATLSAALDKAAVADGELLSSADGSVLTYREDYSLRANVNIAQYRYFEISRFVVRPGHEKEWDDLVKIYLDAYTKVSQNARWATYSSMYGAENGGVYIVLAPFKSLAEVDAEIADGKKFEAELGADGMKKLAELSASCLQENQTNLFAFNPKLSYVADEWVKTDPSFWKPKPAAPASAKKPEAKPAQ